MYSDTQSEASSILTSTSCNALISSYIQEVADKIRFLYADKQEEFTPTICGLKPILDHLQSCKYHEEQIICVRGIAKFGFENGMLLKDAFNSSFRDLFGDDEIVSEVRLMQYCRKQLQSQHNSPLMKPKHNSNRQALIPAHSTDSMELRPSSTAFVVLKNASVAQLILRLNDSVSIRNESIKITKFQFQ